MGNPHEREATCSTNMTTAPCGSRYLVKWKRSSERTLDLGDSFWKGWAAIAFFQIREGCEGSAPPRSHDWMSQDSLQIMETVGWRGWKQAALWDSEFPATRGRYMSNTLKISRDSLSAHSLTYRESFINLLAFNSSYSKSSFLYIQLSPPRERAIDYPL